MSPEEAFAELERKVERQERALRDFFAVFAFSGGTPTLDDLEIAAGQALNVLNGIDE